MKTAKISGSSPKTYAAVYDKLKGVDFSTDPGMIAQERSPWAPNLVSGRLPGEAAGVADGADDGGGHLRHVLRTHWRGGRLFGAQRKRHLPLEAL